MNIGHFNELQRLHRRQKAERADRLVFRVVIVLLAGLFILDAMGV